MLANMRLPERREAAQERNGGMERDETWLGGLRRAALMSQAVMKVAHALLALSSVRCCHNAGAA